MKHYLKTWPHEHDAVASGEKTFEVRKDTDRSFGVGDVLCLQRWDPAAQYIPSGPAGNYIDECGFTVKSPRDAHTICARVTYILHGGRFGLPVGVCVMSIEGIPTPTEGE